MRRRGAILVVIVAALVLAPSAAARQRTYTYYSKSLPLAGYQVLFGRDAQHSHQKGFIVGMSTRIVDSKGKYVPPWRVMLHHIVYSKAGLRDPVCRRLHGERFFGTGEEDRPLQLPHGYGYPIRRKDAWHSSWMIMSHHAQPDRVRIVTTVTVDD